MIRIGPIGPALEHRLLDAGEERRLAARAANDDLFQEGVCGLLRAIDRYDPRVGTRFATYATWWIRKAVSDAVRREQPVPVPEPRERERRRFAAAAADGADDDELARRTGLAGDQLRRARLVHELQQPLRLDRPVATAILEDRTTLTTEEVAWEAIRCRQAERLLESLRSDDEVILRMRFGFDDDVEHKLSDIGHALGISRETVIRMTYHSMRARLRAPRPRPLSADRLRPLGQPVRP